MEVTLLGAGDTTGTPTVGCDCDTCERARELGVERTRFSVHVRNDRTDETRLIDFSPDLRQQFLREGLEAPDAAVVTHVHFDHLHGAGNVFRLTADLPVYAPGEVDPATGESVADTVRGEYDYLDALDERDAAPFEPVAAAGLEVTLVPVDHPPLACYGVRVRDPETGATFAFSGDTTYDVPAESRDVLRNPDLLFADGIVHAGFCEHHPRGGRHHDDEGVPRTFGTKHMTIEGAEALAADLGADRYRLVHVSHFVPADRAFTEPLAVDGEFYAL
jgi:phosphoribosyl 1,2-cyclic phosphate phosphodiesterase